MLEKGLEDYNPKVEEKKKSLLKAPSSSRSSYLHTSQALR